MHDVEDVIGHIAVGAVGAARLDAGELQGLAEANLGLGCGAPVDHLKLQPGEHVLDLGSGAGIDVFLAAKQVGAEGRVIATLVAGDDYVAERDDQAGAAIREALERLTPDLVLAGPAFDSGRYGLGCALACRVAQLFTSATSASMLTGLRSTAATG